MPQEDPVGLQYFTAAWALLPSSRGLSHYSHVHKDGINRKYSQSVRQDLIKTSLIML